jgi:hypothetical protein
MTILVPSSLIMSANGHEGQSLCATRCTVTTLRESMCSLGPGQYFWAMMGNAPELCSRNGDGQAGIQIEQTKDGCWSALHLGAAALVGLELAKGALHADSEEKLELPWPFSLDG